jgi:hypothetical protein
VIGLVILLSFVLLAAVLRSIAIPIRAAVMNILSIGAGYGVIVAVFQRGWGLSAFGNFGTGPIDPWIPLMMLEILGNRTWWMPDWLDRRLPRLVLDADEAEPGAQPA